MAKTRNRPSLRGLNKPICIKCDGAARSRCLFQSCKNCCARAQNPCHIHVLKGNSSYPDSTDSNGISSSSGNAHRVTSIRQLSSNFAQFNNLRTPSRARKPLTRKEAYQINEWRFSKLKEYEDRNIEIENESSARYLQNVTLLEEVFAKYESTEDTETTISNLKTKHRADPIRSENLREKLRFIITEGLRNLKTETPIGNEETEDYNVLKKARYSSLIELNSNLSSAQTCEDLNACRLLKVRLFSQPKQSVEEFVNLEDGKAEQMTENYSSKRFSSVTVSQEAIGHIDAQFTSFDGIEHL
ncbi:uncharacterized protein LOC143589835 [Bidens hawaiensis]|uniref:uncharacterized protein LOC143589835 n=1 Tax=Bidens hawaiensis TaxID=980011 RepID=UPI0040496525